MKKIAAQWLLLAFMATTAGRGYSQQSSSTLLEPVLVVFSASLSIKQEVQLTWTVQQQFESVFFDIEKSTDGLHWTSIVTIPSTAFSSKPVTYNAIDRMPLKGSNLYRLRIGSADGSAVYTAVKLVNANNPVTVRLYPNPSANIITVSLAQRPEDSYWSLSLINQTGQVVLQKKYHNSETKICLPVVNYPSGHYILQISEGKTWQQTTLLINHH